jgi:hypothetical protein
MTSPLNFRGEYMKPRGKASRNYLIKIPAPIAIKAKVNIPGRYVKNDCI